MSWPKTRPRAAIRAAYGQVKTVVCGARRNRVFYGTEIEGACDRYAYPSEAEILVRAILDNKDIESINNAPIGAFRDLWKTKGIEAVYDRICLTELRERLTYAKKTENKDDYADYLDRLELYRVDKTANQGFDLPKAERLLLKQNRIEEFEATAKIMTARKPVVQLTPCQVYDNDRVERLYL